MKLCSSLSHVIIISTLIFVSDLNAQSLQTQVTRNKEFDFWIGDWELTWNDTSKGSNAVTLEMNDKVLYEHFKDPVNNFFGWSWSVYDSINNKWKQTWVDNQGAYLDFVGQMENGMMILERSFTNKQGVFMKQRMVFYNIAKNSIHWRWESSSDGGTNWKINWLIHYKRKGN